MYLLLAELEGFSPSFIEIQWTYNTMSVSDVQRNDLMFIMK